MELTMAKAFRKKLMLALSGCFCLVLSACSFGDNEKTILDAAALFEQKSESFELIRDTYSGPFLAFKRVPDRDPSAVTKEEEAFIRNLRRQVPVEYIDLFPFGRTGKDEIDVILWRYGMDDRWTVVSLIYTEASLPATEEDAVVGSFDNCDIRTLEWIEERKPKGPVAAFCRLNANWYAFQSVS